MLPPRLINESSRAKDCPAAKILNTSIAHSRYPSRWKMGQVMPLFKRDELPVLPCLNNILKDCSRIKCRISTKVDCQTSFQLIDDVTVARPRFWSLRKTGAYAVIWRNWQLSYHSIDVSKALDTIPHPLLLAKLKAYGLRNSACALFADYRAERHKG